MTLSEYLAYIAASRQKKREINPVRGANFRSAGVAVEPSGDWWDRIPSRSPEEFKKALNDSERKA
jgi:hypothetical protein